jgi:hypothetical protein
LQHAGQRGALCNPHEFKALSPFAENEARQALRLLGKFCRTIFVPREISAQTP